MAASRASGFYLGVLRGSSRILLFLVWEEGRVGGTWVATVIEQNGSISDGAYIPEGPESDPEWEA